MNGLVGSSYPKKSRNPLTKEQRDALERVEGFFVQDIMDYYRISYPKALELFKKVKDIYGTAIFDNNQVMRIDVFDYVSKRNKERKEKLVYETRA